MVSGSLLATVAAAWAMMPDEAPALRSLHSQHVCEALASLPQQQRKGTLHTHSPRRAAETARLYIADAKSFFNADGIFDYNAPQQRRFATTIEIDGDRATVTGLGDYFMWDLDMEYPVEGVYDNLTRTVTIPNAASKTIKVADVWHEQYGRYVYLYLCAGTVDANGGISYVDDLKIRLSEDMTTGYFLSSYGLIESSTGNFYDYYKSIDLNAPSATGDVVFENGNIDLTDNFLCVGKPVSGEVMLMNMGAADGAFTLVPSSGDLQVSMTEGTLYPGQKLAVGYTLTPSAEGPLDQTLALIDGNGLPKGTLTFSGNVNAIPDYAPLIKENSAAFEIQPDDYYPWLMTEYDGTPAAVSSNDGHAGTEGFLYCNLDVPQGKTVLFRWNASLEAKRPNGFTVYVDGAKYMSETERPNVQAFPMDGCAAFGAGHHTVGFDMYINSNWLPYGVESKAYVWGLDFQLIDAKADNAALVTDQIQFESTYFDKMPVDMVSEVKVLNTGTRAMRVLEVMGDGNFGGEVPAGSVPTGGVVTVPLQWRASAVGTDNGTVTVRTSGGDLEVHCSGVAEALPFDYSKIVSGGDFSFNTDMQWPFVMMANGKYAYNSSSKQENDGQSDSWLEASFDVPEGMIGKLFWDADNDSDELFELMGYTAVISGTKISIDGGEEVLVGGVGTLASSSALYNPDQLAMRPGRHDVRFTFHKAYGDLDHNFGDDRFKLFELSLALNPAEGAEGRLSEREATFTVPTYVGVTGHFPLTLINYTNTEAAIISTECSAPFSTRPIRTEDGNLVFNVEFTPKAPGQYSGEMTLHTTIGDYVVDCSAEAEESSLGGVIYYEGFEYDFEDSWVISDRNADGHIWERMSAYKDDFKELGGLPYEGAESLFVFTYNPVTHAPYDVDDLAATPEIAIPSEGTTMLRFMMGAHTGYFPQTLGVYAVTEGNFQYMEEIGRFTASVDDPVWKECLLNLDAYAGSSIRLAFVSESNQGEFVAIDQIMVANSATGGVTANSAGGALVQWYNMQGIRLEAPIKGEPCLKVSTDAYGRTEVRRVVK